MSERVCANCACAMRPVGRWFRIILSRWPGLLACISHPEAPGQLREVSHLDTCRNFRRRYRPPVRYEPPKPPNDQVHYIALTKGRFAIVGAADFEWLSRYKWRTSFNGGNWYAATTIKNRNVLMHRLIMDPPKGMVVDHIDRNGLDNRRGNLRICTPEQNRYNCRRARGTSRYKGGSFREGHQEVAGDDHVRGRALQPGPVRRRGRGGAGVRPQGPRAVRRVRLSELPPEEHGRPARPAVATGS